MPSSALFITGSHVQNMYGVTALNLPYTGEESLIIGATNTVEHVFVGHVSRLDETPGKFADGYITDRYGTAEITQFQFASVAIEKPFSFTKQYPGEEWVLRYEFTKKDGACWYGTWQAGQEADGKFTIREEGTAWCLLTPCF